MNNEATQRYITHAAVLGLPSMGDIIEITGYTQPPGYLGKSKYNYQEGVHSFSQKDMDSMVKADMVKMLETPIPYKKDCSMYIDDDGCIYYSNHSDAFRDPVSRIVLLQTETAEAT